MSDEDPGGGPASYIRDVASGSWPSESSPASWNTYKNQVQMQILQLQRIVADLKKATMHDRVFHEAMQKEVGSSRDGIKVAETKLTNLQKVVATQQDNTNGIKKLATDGVNESKNLSAAIEIELNELKVNVETLQRSVEQIRASGGGGTATGVTIPGNISQLFEALERQLSMYDAKIAEMDVRFEVVESTSYNGKIIWKITDFARRREDARRGKTLSIYSQPFYSSKYGYKMCLRIYPNGDGMASDVFHRRFLTKSGENTAQGKNTHISLFFVLMKGDYDSLLQFPFRQKVTLALLDQSPERRHLTDVFRPDPSSSSFRRPVTDMNIASGCPMFATHDTLTNSSYLKEDTIFIKCVVDIGDLENY